MKKSTTITNSKFSFILLSVFIVFNCSFSAAIAQSDSRNLRFNLNDDNTKISFEVDSTWVLVHGSTSDINGNYTIKTVADTRTLSGEVNIPLTSFKTGSESRDEHLQEVMAADKFKFVKVEIEEVKSDCFPTTINKDIKSCSGFIVAKLTIRDVTKLVELPYSISKNEQNEFIISGELPINWAEYNVEDPSILIAKLEPVVKVKYLHKVQQQ